MPKTTLLILHPTGDENLWREESTKINTRAAAPRSDGNSTFRCRLHWELLSIGLRLKYAFINNKEGWSWAGALGVGSSIGGSHYYGDFTGSYMASSWEPYGTLRLVHVKNDPLKFRDTDTGEVTFTVPNYEYNYGQIILGTRYWFTPHWLFSLEGSSLVAMSSGLKISSGILLGAAFGYRF